MKHLTKIFHICHFKKILYYISIIILFGASFSSCIITSSKLETPVCKEIPQGCYPNTYNGKSLYDTSSSLLQQKGFYYRIETVKGLNSPDDEWQIEFISDNKAIMTYSESGINKSILVRRLNEEKFSTDIGIDGFSDGHNGASSYNKGILAFTYSPMVSKNIIKEINSYQMVPESKSIGKGRITIANLSGNSINSMYQPDNQVVDSLDWSGHPAIAPNGKIIVYSSDKSDGYGGNDLWCVFQTKQGTWTKPINLGSIINSKCDEISPYFSKNGKRLYFASSGHQTVGGYDIFYSDIKSEFYTEISFNDDDLNDIFSNPVNLGSPVNTTNDEIFPSSISDFEDIIYYSSNQYSNESSLVEARGGFDLMVCYKVKTVVQEKIANVKANETINTDLNQAKPKEPNFDKVEKNVTIKGKVFSKIGEPIDSATINISAKDDNLEKSVISKKTGDFVFDIERNKQYEITAQKKEYFYDSKRVLVNPDYSQDTMDMNFYLPEIGEIRLNFPTDEYKNPYKFTLDSNGIETGRIWIEELKLVASNIMLSLDRIEKIILVGHTDDVASDDYNMGLGQRRVDFLASELIKLGIPEKILTTRSAGEREPLLKKSDEDINKYRKRLRRVTMQKIFK